MWVVLCCTFALAATALINWLLDPLWIFSSRGTRPHYYNIQDEAEVKSNKLVADGARYKALLIGTSRCTYLDARLFYRPTFNYCVSGLFPRYYKPYIDFFSQINGPPEQLILSFDFIGTNAKVSRNNHPETYIANSNSLLYRVQMLISLRSVFDGIANLRYDRPSSYQYLYSKNGVKHINRGARNATEAMRKEQLDFFRKAYSKDEYEYNAALKTIFKEIRDAYPDSNIVVFTTPTSARLFHLLVSTGRFNDYAKWLGDLVATFGSIEDFMGINSFTTNDDNFIDLHHVYPDVGEALIRRLEDKPLPKYQGFGARITQANLNEHLRAQWNAVQAYTSQ